MTIKLNGSTAGSVALDAPASTTGNADISFKLPVADGSANQVLKTDGSGNLAFATLADTNDFFKLQAATGTSAVADLTFNSLDVTTYRTFKMIFSGYPSTDAAEFFFRFRDGSTDKSNASTYNWTNLGVGGSGTYYDNAGSDSKALICYNAGNNNYEGWRFELTFVPTTSAEPAYQGNFGHTICNRFTENNSHRGENFWFKFHQQDTVDGFRLFPSTGNIAAYSYTLYGLKR